MDMQSLYHIYLPAERDADADKKRYEDWVKKNQDCLNRNFSLLAEKVYELEIRLALLEASSNGA